MRNVIKQNWLGLLAIIIIFGAFWDHPYSYYQTMRWIVAISSAYYSYLYFNSNKTFFGWVFVATAILFNPISPIYLQKHTWQIWDLIVGIVFLVSLFLSNKKHDKTN